MSDTVVPAAAEQPAKAAPKTPKKKASSAASKTKKPADHPKYSEMIHQALTNLKERGGSSRQAILKYIAKNFKVGNDEHVINQHLKIALRSGVKNESLKQSKGSGASGSFRLGEGAKKEKKPVAKKAKKPKAAATKKPAGAKKSVAKSPKKAKKPAAAGAKKTKTDKPKKAKADKPKTVKANKPKKLKVDKPKKAAKPVAAKKTAKPKKAGAKKPAASASKKA